MQEKYMLLLETIDNMERRVPVSSGLDTSWCFDVIDELLDAELISKRYADSLMSRVGRIIERNFW